MRISTSAATDAGELAAIGCASTGGDGGGGGVVGEELLELGQGEQGLLKVVEAELEERSLLDDGGRPFRSSRRRWSR